MAHRLEVKYNNKWWGKVEHRSPWINRCGDGTCTYCLSNRVHSKIKKYMWHMDEWEEQPSSNYIQKKHTHKFSGFPHSKRLFRCWFPWDGKE